MTSNPPPVSRPPLLANLRNWPWRPILACGGALLIARVVAPVAVHPVENTAQSDALDWQIALPLTSTLIVRPMPAPGKAAKGQVRLVSDVVGTSPVDGEVARWLVEPGTRVEKGQPIVEISSGQASRPAPRVEAAQTAAEKKQIAASNAQFALAQQLTTSQIKLRAAQDRVNQAQTHVAETREIIQKLQRGEVVHLPGHLAPAPAPTQGITKEQKAAQAATDKADAAQDAFKQASDAASAAKTEVTAAEKALKETLAQLTDAQAKQDKIEDLFDAGRAVGSEVQDARNAVTDAKAAVQNATARLDAARKAMTARAADATKADADAKSAAEAARKLGSAVTAPTPATPVAAEGENVTLEQASQLVDEALAESRRATREAERLHTLVEDYQRQVNSSQTSIQSAAESLKNAQQRVFDSVPPPQFTPATAATAGTVIWIARLAREVAAGDSVFGLAQGQRYRAFVEDRSNAWKQVHIGQTLAALVMLDTPPTAAPDANPPASTRSGARATPAASTTPGGAASGSGTSGATAAGSAASGSIAASGASTVANLVVTQITAPESNASPAVIEGEIQSGAPVPLEAGMTVLASLPDVSGAHTTIISVPVSAVVARGGSHFVATLEATKPDPLATPTTTPQDLAVAGATGNAGASATPAATPTMATPASNEAAPGSAPMAAASVAAASVAATTATGNATPTLPSPAPALPLLYHLQWREVQLGAGDVLHYQIRAGLRMGERIVIDPQSLLAQVPPGAGEGPLVRLSVE